MQQARPHTRGDLQTRGLETETYRIPASTGRTLGQASAVPHQLGRRTPALPGGPSYVCCEINGHHMTERRNGPGQAVR